MITQGRAVSTHTELSSACGMSGMPHSMSQQMLPGHPSFLVGDCRADPGVDFGVAQCETIP